MMFRKKRGLVCVLGAGPAGLLAAHAARSRGYEQVLVFSRPGDDGKPAKSDLFGCQYLHCSIPGLTYSVDGVPVRYTLDGPAEGYRRKVYGDNYTGPTSVDEYGPARDHYAWDMREAYDRLWDRWLPTIVPVELTPDNLWRVLEDKPSAVLSTLPAPALCRDMENHKFPTESVWAMGSKSAEHALPVQVPNMTVMCNGYRDTGWYRAANVFGYSTVEWAGAKKPPLHGIARVSKPLSTDCSCWLGSGVHRLGRYGKWTKGVLVHTAYFETLGLLP